MAGKVDVQQRAIEGVLEQGQHVAEFLTSLRPAEFCRTVPGTPERARDVTARLLVAQTRLLDALNQPTRERPDPLPEYLHGLRITQHGLTTVAFEMAEHESGPNLALQFSRGIGDLILQLGSADLHAVVATPSPLRTTDLLKAITVEWVLGSDDLTRALPGRRPVPWAKGVRADAVRTLADTLRHHHPGRSVEVRVPPFAAVQCGDPGEPRHTRGTPPTVIECEPLQFVRLCRGRLDFATAREQGQLQASGSRADISDWLPLY